MSTQGSSQPALVMGGANLQQGSDSWLTDRIVTIVVGPQEKRWVIHEKLLISQSDFFKEYFSPAADEDAKRPDEMKLPDEDPKLFNLFIRWLYGTAFLPTGSARNFRYLQPEGNSLTVRDYLGVYIMGYKFGIVGVRNAVIDVLYTYYGSPSDHHQSPDFHDVKYIFDNTQSGAPMRRFLVAHSLFYLFSAGRLAMPLPPDWVAVLKREPEIGFSMVQMLAEWGWTMGDNAPRMMVKPRADFHEKVPFVKEELGEEIVED